MAMSSPGLASNDTSVRTGWRGSYAKPIWSARICPETGGQRCGRGGIAHLSLCVENFEHPLGGALRLPDLCKHAGGGTKRADQNSGKEDEGKEVAR